MTGQSLGREPDRDLLHGHHGPYVQGKKDTLPSFSFDQVHPDLQEILIRMDREEVLAFNKAVKIITSLDQKSLENFKLSLKVFGGLLALGKALKWAATAFFAGLAAVSVAGDQIQKVLGHLATAFKLIKSLAGGGP